MVVVVVVVGMGGVLVVMGGVGGTQVSEGRNVTKRAIIDVILLFLGGIRIF